MVSTINKILASGTAIGCITFGGFYGMLHDVVDGSLIDSDKASFYETADLNEYAASLERKKSGDSSEKIHTCLLNH